MKTVATALIAGLLLVTTAGCGGLNKDEKKAAKSIGISFAGQKPSKARTAVGQCFGKKLVTEAGTDQLKKDKLISSKFTATKTVPKKLSKKSAEAYGDAVVKCFDFKKLKGDIKTQTGAPASAINAYTSCLDKIDDSDLKQAIVDQYTKGKATKTTKKVDTATQACGKKLGS